MSLRSVFKAFPAIGNVTTSVSTVAKQYNVFNSRALIFNGICDYDAAYRCINTTRHSLCSNYNEKLSQTLYPIKFANNKAGMIVWMSEFFDSNHGNHNELNFSVFLKNDYSKCDELSNIDVKQQPWHVFLNILFDKNQFTTTPCVVYNNCNKVVAYNNEYLKLPAKLATFDNKNEGLQLMSENKAANNMFYKWTDSETNNAIIDGYFKQQPLFFNDIYSMYKELGIGKIYQFVSLPYLESTVTNLECLKANVYLAAPIKDTKSFKYDDNKDVNQINVKDESLKQLNFEPILASQYPNNLQFAYQPPTQYWHRV